MQLLSTNVCFGGEHRRYQHHSAALDCDMEFAVYLPPVAVGSNPQKVPVLYWLSGLTCTDQNFMQKAGAQKKRRSWALPSCALTPAPVVWTCPASTTVTILAAAPVFT